MSPVTVVEGWDLRLGVDEVLAAQGADGPVIRRRNPGIARLAARALEEARPLLAPRSVFEDLAITARDARGLILAGGGRLDGPPVERGLDEATRVVAAVCTIGPALEARASEALAGDAAYGLALDGVGSAAVDALARALCRRVSDAARARGDHTTAPFSPGMAGWPLAGGQRQLFSLVDGRQVGVMLTESSVMVPSKSASMVIGTGRHVAAGDRSCALCEMKATCRYRGSRNATPV
jgi:hypothetical protein